MAHGLGIGAVTQTQSEGIQHDGLAGAGLPGDDGHARTELHLQGGDDGVVTDTDVGKHSESAG